MKNVLMLGGFTSGPQSFIVRIGNNRARIYYLMGPAPLLVSVSNEMVHTAKGNTRVIAREKAAAEYLASIGAI